MQLQYYINSMMTQVFIADAKDAGLIIYNMNTSKFRKIKSDFMKATNTNFVIEDHSYSAIFGITGLTIIDKGKYFFLTKEDYL